MLRTPYEALLWEGLQVAHTGESRETTKHDTHKQANKAQIKPHKHKHPSKQYTVYTFHYITNAIRMLKCMLTVAIRFPKAALDATHGIAAHTQTTYAYLPHVLCMCVISGRQFVFCSCECGRAVLKPKNTLLADTTRATLTETNTAGSRRTHGGGCLRHYVTQKW